MKQVQLVLFTKKTILLKQIQLHHITITIKNLRELFIVEVCSQFHISKTLYKIFWQIFRTALKNSVSHLTDFLVMLLVGTSCSSAHHFHVYTI